MAGQIILFPFTIVVSGGIGTLNTTDTNGFQSWVFGGLLRNIYLKAPSIGKVFDFKITSPNSFDTFERQNITTELSEDINFCVRGTHEMKIENAGVDGSYTGEVGFEVGRP